MAATAATTNYRKEVKMSARTQNILEDINRLKAHIVTLEESGQDPLSIQKEVARLERELQQANHILSESRVIKG